MDKLQSPYENDDLWIDRNDCSEIPISIMTYNINCSIQAMIPPDFYLQFPNMPLREMIERFPDVFAKNWLSRSGRIEALIKKYNPDIVCIQELRKLPGTRNPIIWLYEAFGDDYEIFETSRNGSPLAFGQAIMWKRDKFSSVAFDKKWISPTPEIPSNGYQSGNKGFGQIATGVLLQRCYKEKFVRNTEPFWIYNVHLLLEEDLKTKSCIMLGELSRQLKYPCIFAGDFNLFPDKDGDKQFDILRGYFTDCTRGSVTSQEKMPLRGTFIGTQSDKFRRKIEEIRQDVSLEEKQEDTRRILDSKLDQIIGSKQIALEGTPLILTETMLDKEPREFDVMKDGELNIDYPSDHMPIFTSVIIR